MKKNNPYLLGITLVATLGGLLFGYDTAVISGAVKPLENFFIAPLGLSELSANSLKGFILSSALLGCILGGALAGYLSNRLGRKKTLKIAALLFLLSALGSARPELFFNELELQTIIGLFVFFRFLGGIGVGIASLVSPLYIAEISPEKIRGRLVSLNQLAIVLGISVVYFVNYYIGQGANEQWLNEIGWRRMFLSEVIPATLFLLLLMMIPESPRWLILKNKIDEAKIVLNKLYSSIMVDQITEEVLSTIQSVEKAKLFTYGKRVVVIGILLSVFQQFIGINVVLYYAKSIFEDLGSGSDAAFLQTIVVGLINVLFTVVAIYTVDRLGRKPLMVTGSIVMGLAMLSLGTSFYVQADGVIALVFMLVYVAGFSLSWGPVTWVLLSEIFPNRIRGAAMAIAVAAQWIANFLVSQTFPIMDENTYLTETFNKGFPYWLYGFMGLLSAIIVWKLVPESKGKTLEQIERFWKQ